MNTAEQNYRLLQEIDANRRFLLMAYQQNPKLLERAEPRVRQLFETIASRGPEELRAGAAGRQRGISLVELIIFIVIISTALAGILLVMNQVTTHSADPLIRKQALAVAESLLEEVELMPFTYCDPDDASAVTAASTAGCTTVETTGVENDVSRYDTALPFDNVSDYHGFGMAAGSIMDITNTNSGLSGYTLQPVTVAAVDFGGITAASGDALLITVTVTDPAGNDIVLEGIRTRYSPNSVP